MEFLVIRNMTVNPIDKDGDTEIEIFDIDKKNSNCIFLSKERIKQLIDFLNQQLEK